MIVTRIESEERNEVFLNETSIVITDHFPLQSIVHSRSSLADFLWGAAIKKVLGEKKSTKKVVHSNIANIFQKIHITHVLFVL